MGPEKLALRHRRVVRYAQDDYTPEINEDPLEGFERAWQVRPHDYHGGWKHEGGSLHKPLPDDYPNIAQHARMAHTLGVPQDSWKYEPTPVDRADNLPRVLGQQEYGLLAILSAYLGPEAEDAWHQLHRGDTTAALGLLDMAEERGLLTGADQALSDKIRRQIDHGMLAADDAAKDNSEERFYDQSLTDLNGEYMRAHADTFDTMHAGRDTDAWEGDRSQYPPQDQTLLKARAAEVDHQVALGRGRKDANRLNNIDYENRKKDPLYHAGMMDDIRRRVDRREVNQGKDAEQQALRRHHTGTGQPAGQRGTIERQRQLQGHVEQQEQAPEPEPPENLGTAPYDPPYQRKQQYARHSLVNAARGTLHDFEIVPQAGGGSDTFMDGEQYLHLSGPNMTEKEILDHLRGMGFQVPRQRRRRAQYGALRKYARNVGSDIEEAASKFTEEELNGLYIWQNKKTGKLVVDVMDWGDEDVAKEIIGAACKGCPEEDILWQNEGAKPQGPEWKSLLKGGSKTVKYGALRSPAGGVVVRGIHYPGGKWIPAKGPEATSYSKWEKIHKYQRGDGSFDYEGMSGDEDVVKLSKSIANLGDYAHPKKTKKSRRGQKVQYGSVGPSGQQIQGRKDNQRFLDALQEFNNNYGDAPAPPLEPEPPDAPDWWEQTQGAYDEGLGQPLSPEEEDELQRDLRRQERRLRRRRRRLGYSAHPEYEPEEDWPDREEANPFDQQSQPAQRTRQFLQSEQQDDAPDWDFSLELIGQLHPDLLHLVEAARAGDHAAIAALLDALEDRPHGVDPESQGRRRRDFDTHRQWIAQGGDRPQRPQRPIRW